MLIQINSTLIVRAARISRSSNRFKKALVLLVIASLMSFMPINAVVAQQDSSIKQLKEEIALMLEIERRADVTPEVKQINAEFLRERRNQLKAMLKGRIDALRQYHATMSKALSAEETRRIENSLRDLETELGLLNATPGARFREVFEVLVGRQDTS